MVKFKSRAERVLGVGIDSPIANHIVNRRPEKLIELARGTEDDGNERITLAYITNDKDLTVNFTDIMVGEESSVHTPMKSLRTLNARREDDVAKIVVIHTHPDNYPAMSIQDLVSYARRMDMFDASMVVGFTIAEVWNLLEEEVPEDLLESADRNITVHGIEWVGPRLPFPTEKDEIIERIQTNLKEKREKDNLASHTEEAYEAVLESDDRMVTFTIDVGPDSLIQEQ